MVVYEKLNYYDGTAKFIDQKGEADHRTVVVWVQRQRNFEHSVHQRTYSGEAQKQPFHQTECKQHTTPGEHGPSGGVDKLNFNLVLIRMCFILAKLVVVKKAGAGVPPAFFTANLLKTFGFGIKSEPEEEAKKNRTLLASGFPVT